MTATPASFRKISRDDLLEFPDKAVDSILCADRERALATHRVVLVHCSASSSRQWNPLVARLDGYAPIAPDLFGHGDRAPWRGCGLFTLAEEARIIAEACPDGAPFHLIGHSYGGAVALNFALHHPGRVRSLTLIEPSSFHVLKTAPGNVDAQLAEIQAVADAVERRVVSGDASGAMEGFVDYWSGPGYWSTLAADRRAQFARLAPIVAAQFRSLIGDDTVLATYARIVVPTLVLCGMQSPGPSRTIARLLAETLPMARLRAIRGVGHMAPITHPDDVNLPILAHLSAVDLDLDLP